MDIPGKQKVILNLLNRNDLFKDIKIKKYQLKAIKDINDLNIYRFEKFLDETIPPNYFYYYYKDPNVRKELNKLIKNIEITNKIDNNNWIEESDLYERKFKIKVHQENYEIIFYPIDEKTNETLSTFDLLKLMIRSHNNKYLIRLEVAFNIFDMDQEVEMLGQIETITNLEKIIIQTLKK